MQESAEFEDVVQMTRPNWLVIAGVGLLLAAVAAFYFAVNHETPLEKSRKACIERGYADAMIDVNQRVVCLP